MWRHQLTSLCYPLMAMHIASDFEAPYPKSFFICGRARSRDSVLQFRIEIMLGLRHCRLESGMSSNSQTCRMQPYTIITKDAAGVALLPYLHLAHCISSVAPRYGERLFGAPLSVFGVIEVHHICRVEPQVFMCRPVHYKLSKYGYGRGRPLASCSFGWCLV